MAGLFSRFFGGKKGYKKYEDIFKSATKMGQSVEYAFKQAADSAMADGVFQDKKEAYDKLYEAISSKIDPEKLPELQKAKDKLKRLAQ